MKSFVGLWRHLLWWSVSWRQYLAIDLNCYPDLRGMIYVDPLGLHQIHSKGALKPVERLNGQFREDVTACYQAYLDAPDKYVLGWFLPKGEGSAEHIWRDSCSLRLEDRTFEKLSDFESSMKARLADSVDGPKYPLTQTMSAHEGMRKLWRGVREELELDLVFLQPDVGGQPKH